MYTTELSKIVVLCTIFIPTDKSKTILNDLKSDPNSATNKNEWKSKAYFKKANFSC